ncbi:unnamed protein product [Withania somnifera]
MASNGSCTCSSRPIICDKSDLVNQFSSHKLFIIPRGVNKIPRICIVRASAVDGSSNFVQRIEKAWLISKQPRPIICSTCDSNGLVDCKWCGGTGFFILGDNMLCQVPSRNTSCVICAGKGSVCCTDCKGTGHRAKWLGDPPIPSPPITKK